MSDLLNIFDHPHISKKHLSKFPQIYVIYLIKNT